MSQSNVINPFGQYPQYREISSKHLTKVAITQLYDALQTDKDYDCLMFKLFSYPAVNGRCLGVKLLAIPWSDDSLRYQFDLTLQILKQKQLLAGLPECFVEVLHLAATANTRIVVFDPEANELKGLPIYD